MSSEQVAETVAEVVERRKFLAKAGASALAVLGVSAFVPATAKALFNTHGCQLCNDPNDGCGPNLDCAWCWVGTCTNGHTYNCCEGRQTGGDCGDRHCPAYCSFYTLNGNC
jgi:hypothetical protein